MSGPLQRYLLPAAMCVGWLGASLGCLADWPALRYRDPARQQVLRAKLDLIRLERPRILLNADQIDRARARIARVPEVAECYGWLRQWAYSDQFYRNLWVTPKQLQAAVVAYRLEQRPPKILAHCIAMMDYMCEAQPDSWTYPRVVRGLSMAYDWLYEGLTQAQKHKYAARIIECAKACYSTWRHSELNNHLYLEYGPVLYAGIALYKEPAADQKVVEQLLLDGIELLLDNFIPAHELISYPDGGWYESMGYHAFFTPEYAHLLELWANATGEDVWQSRGGLQGDAAWLVYNARPWDYTRVGVADIGGRNSQDLGIAWYLPLLVARHEDGLAKYWLEHLKAGAKAGHARGEKYAMGPHMWWPYVVWYDPEVEATDPKTLPLARIFRGLGWVSMRSSWEPDATFALFVCGDWFGGHQHCDNNSFVIHKYAPLAIDSGVYDAGPHRANYSARTIAHNSILVYDPDERFSGGTWGQHTDAAHRTENDGGQLYTPSPARPRDVLKGSVYDRADIVAYRLGPDYTYVVGDATRSYSPRKMKEFTRAFLHLRPDLFVVFDRVEATNAEFKKTWLLHSVNEPRIEGATVTVQNGEGSLWCRTLLPVDATITKVGGQGREFEVNGKNFPSKKAHAESGAWRVEVVPRGRAARQYFLHVLSTGESGGAPTASVTTAEGTVRVRIEAQSGVYTVRFNTTGPLRGYLTIADAEGARTRRFELGDEVEASQ
ncbi:MAG: heparinase II/III family protein [Armatimonadota bacterium]